MKSDRFYLRLALSLVAVLAVICPFVAFADTPRDQREATEQILALAERYDIVIFGEQHTLRDARRLLMKVLGQGMGAGRIDGFATEYVLEENEADFQNYLRDPQAGRGSANEGAFFAKINATGYVWLKDELNKDFFRFLRELKINHPHVAICGMDARGSKDKEVRRASFARLPPALLKAAVEAYRVDLNQMIEATTTNYDREALMALHTADCLAGSRHSIVHVGSFHAWSLKYDATADETPEEKTQSGWKAMSQFLPSLLPGKTIVAISTAQAFDTKPDPMVDAFRAAHALFHRGEPHRTSLMPTYTANPEIKAVLHVERAARDPMPLWPVWDYLILGPQGDAAPIWE